MSWILNKFSRIAKFRLDFSGSCQKTGTIEIFLQKIQKQRLITQKIYAKMTSDQLNSSAKAYN